MKKYRPFLKIEYKHALGQGCEIEIRNYDFGREFKKVSDMIAFQHEFDAPIDMMMALGVPWEIEVAGKIFKACFSLFSYIETT